MFKHNTLPVSKPNTSMSHNGDVTNRGVDTTGTVPSSYITSTVLTKHCFIRPSAVHFRMTCSQKKRLVQTGVFRQLHSMY